MKSILILVAFIAFFCFSCTNQLKQNQQMIDNITLSERTRGTQRVYTISSENLKIAINGEESDYKVSHAEWSKLAETASAINLEEISAYKAPTTKRFSDAALASTIKVSKENKEFESVSFDEGNPPTELKNLYFEMKKLIKTKKSN
ncbi:MULTISPECIES: hypothetical protein [Chryseobacterium]|uniref:Lipoprotein n=1 Tax=Chryseobacterium taihuense TaxID=1141221 RepID=A0A4U8WF17_9FLAO|nr:MULTISPECIES: hypothetical protein [Chryseobacterium]QQV01962.1 hypothetical protein I6I61_12875 [Chryseobacterium sp. FDAARGOS 1104]VFB04813.1 Uncharacterised protein [Chryseobacterium taihuense]